jgi:GTP cyclohydrolase II
MPAHVAVERALPSSGPPPGDHHRGERLLALPVDGMDDGRLAACRRLCGKARPYLVITARRADTLGLVVDGPVGLAIGEREGADAILSLVTDVQSKRRLDIVPSGRNAGAAIELAKRAQRLPALLVANASAMAAFDPPLMFVSAEAVLQFRHAAIASLAVGAEANVPLNGGTPARFVIFRDAIGGSSIAVIVGTPDLARPVPVRLHSACLTGSAHLL